MKSHKFCRKNITLNSVKIIARKKRKPTSYFSQFLEHISHDYISVPPCFLTLFQTRKFQKQSKNFLTLIFRFRNYHYFVFNRMFKLKKFPKKKNFVQQIMMTVIHDDNDNSYF